MMHALQHLYASECLAEGMNVVTLSQRLGHTDPAHTVRICSHQVSNNREEEQGAYRQTLRGTTVPRSAPDVQR